jgi:hypothetical protein
MTSAGGTDRSAEFDAKAEELKKQLRAWYDDETSAIDGSILGEAPSGSGGSIMDFGPTIDSKRVVDATLITETVLGIELPPEIIKPGGYNGFEEMIDHIIPLLKKVFSGELKVKKSKTAASASQPTMEPQQLLTRQSSGKK